MPTDFIEGILAGDSAGEGARRGSTPLAYKVAGVWRYDVPAFRKQADTGGDGQDASYEQTMSDIADIVLKDRAPALRQYEVGFQLIDRDEDGDDHRAVGVKVFKVGKSWLFVPVFFLNGEVKGTELLYLKNQDCFVPLQEDWIRHLLNKETQPIGSQVGRHESSRTASRPDLSRLVRPPAKYAAEMPAASRMLLEEVLPSWAHSLTGGGSAAPAPTLPDFLKSAGAPAVAALHAVVADRPALAGDLARFHGDEILGAIKEAAAARPAPPAATKSASWLDEIESGPAHPLVSGALRIALGGRRLGWTAFDDLEKTASDGDDDVRVADDRGDDEVSSIVAEEDAVAHLSNPTTTGIYDVLVRPGTYEKCLVAIGAATCSGPAEKAYVVRLKDKVFAAVAARHVWADGRKEYTRRDWDDLVSGLPEAGKPHETPDDPYGPPNNSDGASYREATMYLGGSPHRAAVAPLTLRSAVAGPGGTTYRVDFRMGSDDWGWDAPRDDPRGASCGYAGHAGHGHVQLGSKLGGRLRTSEGTLLVPEGFKELKVRSPKHDEEVLAPAGPELRLIAFRKLARTLEVSHGPGGYSLGGTPRVKAGEALATLVAGVGLREDAAREALAAANAAGREGRAATFLVKAADPYLSSRGGSAAGLPEPWWTSMETLEGSVPGTEHQVEEVPAGGDRAADADLSGYDVRTPPRELLKAVQDAAGTGQREIFDASMIGSLLSTTQPDLQVDRHLGAMFGGCDAVGRVLMAYYWHKKQFAERYGEQDLAPLEDQLRNVFLELGKLILNLKQKAVRAPFDLQRGMDLDVSDI